MTPALYVLGGLALFFLLSSVRIVQEYERGIVFRLGSCLSGWKGPGLVLILPFGIDRMVKVDIRTITMDVPPQDIITRDNISVQVDAVVYFQIVDPRKAILAVEQFYYATSKLAQTTLRSVAGQRELDHLLTEREELNMRLQEILDKHTDPWGIKVTLVEIKQIDLPQEMRRAMARQAEAERERRSKVIKAAAELEASAKLLEAADQMSRNPVTVQLRYLQTLSEIAADRNTTTFLPIPIELFNVMRPSLPATTAVSAPQTAPSLDKA